jgi:hypothetical protein
VLFRSAHTYPQAMYVSTAPQRARSTSTVAFASTAPQAASPAAGLAAHGTWVQDAAPYSYTPVATATPPNRSVANGQTVTFSQSAGAVPVGVVSR